MELINIGQILMIWWFLESGQRDLPSGDIGFRVWDPKSNFGLGFTFRICKSCWLVSFTREALGTDGGTEYCGTECQRFEIEWLRQFA